MKHVVSYSGGMGSFAEAKACVDKWGAANTTLLFCDTLMEDEDLYRFLNETTAFLGCELVTISAGMTPWEVFKKHKFIGNSRVDLCSRILKRELMSDKTRGWLFKTYGETPPGHIDPVLKGCEVHVGIDFSEHHRLTRVQQYMAPSVYRSTLVEDGRIISKDFSEQFGIKRPRLYTLGFSHNNCGGFCVKAGLGHFKTLHEALPERYMWHEEKEQELLALGYKPFLRKRLDNTTRYISMREYRKEFLETGKAKEDKFDIGGCACALPIE